MESISEIKQIDNLNHVHKFLRRNSLLLVDIDDTLITPSKSYLIEDPNEEFRNMIGTGIRNGELKTHKGDFKSYCNKTYIWILRRYNTRTAMCKWSLTNPRVPHLVNKWSKKCCTLGFTARGIEIYKTTKQTIRNLGIRFGRTKLKAPLIMPNITCGRTGIGDEGIIFCGGYSKAHVLKWVREEANFHIIKSIVFIDDSLKNLEDVKQYCKEINMNYVGLHYVKD